MQTIPLGNFAKYLGKKRYRSHHSCRLCPALTPCPQPRAWLGWDLTGVSSEGPGKPGLVGKPVGLAQRAGA